MQKENHLCVIRYEGLDGGFLVFLLEIKGKVRRKAKPLYLGLHRGSHLNWELLYFGDSSSHPESAFVILTWAAAVLDTQGESMEILAKEKAQQLFVCFFPCIKTSSTAGCLAILPLAAYDKDVHSPEILEGLNLA